MCFTYPGGSRGVPPLTDLCGRVGSLPKNLRPEASEASSEPKILSFRRFLGPSDFAGLKRPGGSPS